MITSIHLGAFICGLFIMALLISVVLLSERKDGISAMCYSLAGLAYVGGQWHVASGILVVAFAARWWLFYRHQGRQMVIARGALVALQLLVVALNLVLPLHFAWLCILPLVLQVMAFMELEGNDDEQLLQAQHNELNARSLPVISWGQAVTQYNLWRQEHNHQVALLLLQVEGYEQLNRSLGQEFAELVLMQSLARINQVAAQPTVLNLQKRQQFAVEVFQVAPLCYGLVIDISPDSHCHERLAEDITEVLQKPFNSRHGVVELKPHIALSTGMAAETSLDDLLQQGYKAIEYHPQQRICHYNDALEQQAAAHQQQLHLLSTADFERDFSLYFQPVIDLEGNKPLYAELLLRWQHPERGVVEAKDFISDLRAVGRGYKLAFHVLERAAEMAMALKMDGLAMPVSVNLFGEEILHDEFVEFAGRILREHTLKPGDLIIECPLQVVMSLDKRGLALLTRLHQQGIHLCLDGMGETPLFLAKLPKINLEYVKVDPSLTADVDYTSANKALLNGLIDMHRHLKAKVICQGVGTSTQLSYVKEFNVQGAQGYVYTHPLPADGLLSWTRQWHHQQQSASTW
ncbi:EAL domain-containing protein [Pseudoalteromonas sp. BDTF-M6]|uniref:EAL domain-containing protein n=1 Tax=Pseudoalteromonas sp. BDTF-M6 TaxID=2796132 RepID=UPI001BB000CB|nr:EAL domain-containing protein [Pseudoalteromonas sp. BDTF-M6]MBS3799127.1 EAL domain-containing protein [Pseudoalteromonas sp. BDTF-M6]